MNQRTSQTMQAVLGAFEEMAAQVGENYEWSTSAIRELPNGKSEVMVQVDGQGVKVTVQATGLEWRR